MTRPKVLTPDAAGRELAKVLRVAASREEQLRDIAKERKGEIAALHKRARELMAIANGEAQQVELDTGEDEGEPTAPPAQAAEVLAGRKGKRKRKDNAAEVRAASVAYAESHGPKWLAQLVASPGAPLFVPGKWWPEVGADGKLAHEANGGRCPVRGRDWRECATCLLAASAGPGRVFSVRLTTAERTELETGAA